MKAMFNKIVNRNTNIVSNEIDVSLVPEHIRARVEKEKGNESTPMVFEKAKTLFKVVKQNVEMAKSHLNTPQVKNTVYSLKEIVKAFNNANVKDKILIAQEIVEATKLQKDLCMFFLDMKPVSTHQGIEVVQCDDLILGMSGILPRQPGACLVKQVLNPYKIVVNSGFLELPEWAQKAILDHEYGHFVCDHINKSHGVRVFEHELEADAYSASLGNDMLGALQELAKHNTLFRNQTEYKKRLEALKAL